MEAIVAKARAGTRRLSISAHATGFGGRDLDFVEPFQLLSINSPAHCRVVPQ
jgi:hypothetical protein